MAKLIQLMSETRKITDLIYENHRKADQFREIEFNAAVAIQSWYRGLRTRAYIKNLNHNAIMIQKNWRGFLGRKKYRIILEEGLIQMRLQFYNEKACLVIKIKFENRKIKKPFYLSFKKQIKIQKTWRGYYSRKYISNYYNRKAYLNAIQQKNEVILNELREYKDYMEKNKEEKKNMLKYKRLEEEAKRNHYLISTRQIPGVYNSPYKPNPTEMEYLMRNVKLDAPEKHELYVRAFKANRFDSIELPASLPPLNLKPQGPFRDPLEVRKQRYRPFSPSLRVETEYDGLEKARKALKENEKVARLHDEKQAKFYPIDKTIYKKPYEPLMLTKSKYKLLDYGRKHFREESKSDEWSGENRFKTLVPPVPEFNKLNKTYVESHYYLS